MVELVADMKVVVDRVVGFVVVDMVVVGMVAVVDKVVDIVVEDKVVGFVVVDIVVVEDKVVDIVVVDKVVDIVVDMVVDIAVVDMVGMIAGIVVHNSVDTADSLVVERDLVQYPLDSFVACKDYYSAVVVDKAAADNIAVVD